MFVHVGGGQPVGTVGTTHLVDKISDRKMPDSSELAQIQIGTDLNRQDSL